MAGNGKSKTSAAQTETELKQIEAVRLRREGLTFSEIAERLRYANKSCAFAAYTTGLSKARSKEVDALREEQGSMLDELLLEPYEAALEGDLDALSAVLKIMERKARLHCLDKKDIPVKVDLPRLEKPEDAVAVVAALLNKAAEGSLSPEDAGKLAGLVQSMLRVSEVTELVERLRKLEEQYGNESEHNQEACGSPGADSRSQKWGL